MLRSPLLATVFAASVIAAQSAYAAECAEVELTGALGEFATTNQINIIKPRGQVADIQRCDTNGDKWVDIADIRNIALARNQRSAHPDDPMDWDNNGVIDLLDVRGCQLACAAPRCEAIPPGTPPPEEVVGGRRQAAQCSQAEDIDNDGEPDRVVAVSQVPETAGRSAKSPNLELVIIQKNAQGEVTAFKEPFAGYGDDEKTEIHLSKQPPTTINLNPGTVEIKETATVSYRNGIPRVIYFWEDGKLLRAPFLIDD